jgi:hypothetical protein
MTNTTDIRADLETFIGGPLWKRNKAVPALDASIAEIEASGIFADLTSREAYLGFVADYKEVINRAETEIRKIKAARRSSDDNTRYTAQYHATQAGDMVTLAIRMRRLGKRWSADVRSRQLAA